MEKIMHGVWRDDPAWRRCFSVLPLLLLLQFFLAQAALAQFSGGGPPGGPQSRPQPRPERPEIMPVYGPTGPEKLVVDVRIVGNDAVPEYKVYSYLRTRKDRAFDPEILQTDVRSLASAGLFRDVRTYTEDVEGGVVVTFEVFERPTIRYLKFVGNRGLSDKALRKEAGLTVGEALNYYAVVEAQRKLEDYYRRKGYPKAVIDLFEGGHPQDKGVVFVISEGELQRISSVTFIGNTIATDARLRTQIESKPGIFWYLFRGKVDRAKIDEDVVRLESYYRSLGYFQAEIGRELRFDDQGKWLTLQFVINEGPQYHIRNVNVVGNEKFSSEDLLAALELKEGAPFHQGKMNVDLATLRDAYGCQGYVFADVQANPRFMEEPGQLDLVYTIEEGKQYRVGKINVVMNSDYPHTRQKVVLNRISLRPGDIIDIRKLRDSERRLKSSQLFETNPAIGEPQIVIRPPKLDEVEALAESKSAVYRGQSPEDDAEWVVLDVMDP